MTGTPVPVGTIVIRNIKRPHTGRGASRVTRSRFIKVRSHGPPAGRWILYARWWWIHNRGPIPEGKRVVHLDNDSLNDSPDNLALLTPADVVFLAHDRNPEMSERNYAAMREGTRRANIERARLNRMLHWLPTRWYAVDDAAGTVRNLPRRNRYAVLNDFGISAHSANGRGWLSAALGWPELSTTAACILAALLDGPATKAGILSAIERIRRRHRLPHARLKLHSLPKFIWEAGNRITSFRARGRRHIYRITDEARAERGKVFPFILLRGADLAADPFSRFVKLDRLADGSLGGFVRVRRAGDEPCRA